MNIKKLLGNDTEAEKTLNTAVEQLESKAKTLETAKEQYEEVATEIEQNFYKITEEKEHAAERLEETRKDIKILEDFEQILEKQKEISKIEAMVLAYERQYSNLFERARGKLYNPAKALLTADLALEEAIKAFDRDTHAFRNDSNKERFEEVKQDFRDKLTNRAKIGKLLQKLDLLEVNQWRNASHKYIFQLDNGKNVGFNSERG